MSVNAIRWAWEQPAKGPDKTVLLCLAWHALGDGSCRISIAALSQECGLSYRTVRYAIEALVEAKLLDAERVRRTVTSYHLIGAPHAHGTTHTVVQGAPHAPKEWIEQVKRKAFEQGQRVGYRLGQEDAERRGKVRLQDGD